MRRAADGRPAHLLCGAQGCAADSRAYHPPGRQPPNVGGRSLPRTIPSPASRRLSEGGLPMAFTTEFVEQGRGVLYRGSGVLTGDEMIEAKKALLADPARARARVRNRPAGRGDLVHHHVRRHPGPRPHRREDRPAHSASRGRHRRAPGSHIRHGAHVGDHRRRRLVDVGVQNARRGRPMDPADATLARLRSSRTKARTRPEVHLPATAFA